MSIPAAAGARVPFASLPADLRQQVSCYCGGAIDAVEDRLAGFSPGIAAAVGGPDGWCFVKAVHVDVNPVTPGMHRREAEVLEMLAGTSVRAPRLLRVIERDGWVVLVAELMLGSNPLVPWDADALPASGPSRPIARSPDRPIARSLR